MLHLITVICLQAKLLPLKVFAWDANSLSRHFRDCKNGSGFCSVWKEVISGRLSSDGKFAAEEEEIDTTSQQPSTSAQHREQPSPVSPPVLMPAMKIAHPLCDVSESDMDRKIQDHFLGMCVNYLLLHNLFTKNSLRLLHAACIISL